MERILKEALDNTFGNHKLYKINNHIYIKVGDYYVYLNKYTLITEHNTDKDSYRLVIFNPDFYQNTNNYDLLIDKSDYIEIN